jgi:DNA polymerase-3 subunit alpha
MVDRYIERKHRRERVEYPHPLLSDVLSETYGILLYQEQLLKCIAHIAGYTLSEADILFRTMKRGNADVTAKDRAKFIRSAKNNGVDADNAGEIFDILKKFTGVCFNKSHGVVSALISYQAAYLKAHYRKEFMDALKIVERA